MNKNSVIMGWDAPPIKEQHPVLSEAEAARFDDDNTAITRLSVRGIISQTEAANARKRYVKRLETAIRTALAKPPQNQGLSD